ncbi:unnamed protein product [Bursaphelenchus okinawaensis]|uniref:Uncharacterized protein n=1 Tax=Bursaphelenchus okinawaensis TaxID=465554 RepID=A0A811LM70_9BILA|nr:unnamed protein product [Bursaphelenchus okinawaensis]CAG9127911.1 unnamed protein product [Bursaphelenchus okinawaensis]
MYDTPKYLAVHTIDNKLVIINKETGERQQVCEWTQNMYVYVISENNSLVIKGGFDWERLMENYGWLVYSITRRRFVFDESKCFTPSWYLVNSNTLFHTWRNTCLAYNKQTDDWVEVNRGPQLHVDEFIGNSRKVKSM